MSESNVPSDEVKKLLEFLSRKKLIHIDKIIKPINELEIDFIDKNKLGNAWNELFSIEVRMIDHGKETDTYYVHD